MTSAAPLQFLPPQAPTRRGPPPAAGLPDAPLEAVWARDEAEVREAQRLRWRVFVEELGATVSPPPGAPPRHDVDAFDPHCEHLLVRTVASDDAPSRLVGTYRLLTPAGAQRAGGWYTESEFDLASLAPLAPGMIELGRSCVDPAWRSGAVILALWGSLAQFMHRHRVESVVGCGSVPMHDGGINAASLWRELARTHLAAPEWHVAPRLPLPVEWLPPSRVVDTPPLIKGYLRCGAKVLGPPAWDPEFRCADLPLLLRWQDLAPAYRRHFAGA
jgi:putative hemolysin